ncbi:hypothetical protein R9208_10235 [Flammeovirgaceae bacterium SG7u.132]|nr:hypothetical protein [Flammeovirgaceae bacterium SG7u.132]
MKHLNKIYLITFLILPLLSLTSCESGDASFDVSNPSTSKGGSTATFALKNDYLYVVDTENLMVFDTRNESDSKLINTIQVGWGVETIFPFQNLLLLGTQSGVFIYDVSSPASPRYISDYQHIVACDPVVTDGKYAYLTLREGTACRRAINELQVLDMTDITNPQLITQVNMSNPKGLALHGNMLYVCDEGVKVYDVSDQRNPVLIDQIQGIQANDIIYHRNQLLVTAEEGFYQFDIDNLQQLSYYTYL